MKLRSYGICIFCLSFVFYTPYLWAEGIRESGIKNSRDSESRGDKSRYGREVQMTVELPEPRIKGSMSVEEALNRRHSVREFRDTPLDLNQVSQLLWACGGRRINGTTGATRTYPSAGGCYPLEIYLVAGRVLSLKPGVYRYIPKKHKIELVIEGDLRLKLARAALGQVFIAEAPASIVITAVYKRTVRVYGERGFLRYVPMDAGHSAQNIYLESAALGLGTVAVGAFIDAKVSDVIGIGEGETPLYIFPVGYPEK